MTKNELIYGLNDKPAAPACLAAAFQHMLASFVGVITPTLIITAALDLLEHTAFLISMALMVFLLVVHYRRVQRLFLCRS